MTVWYCAIVISSHPSPRRETRAVFKQLGTLDSATSPGCDTLSPADAGLYSSTHSLAGRISRRESFDFSVKRSRLARWAERLSGMYAKDWRCLLESGVSPARRIHSPRIGIHRYATTNAHIQPGEGQTNHLSPAPIPWLNTTYHP